MKPKQAMYKFIEGIHNISPAQQLHAKMVGNIGGFFGLIFAMVALLWNKMWYFTPFLVFMIFLQYLEFIGARQQWKQICELQDNIAQMEQKDEIKKPI